MVGLQIAEDPSGRTVLFSRIVDLHWIQNCGPGGGSLKRGRFQPALTVFT